MYLCGTCNSTRYKSTSCKLKVWFSFVYGLKADTCTNTAMYKEGKFNDPVKIF